jgi:hypothetical protein
MKYIPPFGRESEGEAAHYINGNPVEGREGSIPDAMSWEAPLRELTFLIKKEKLTPNGDDLTQVLQAVRSQAANFLEDTGSVNSLSVACDPPLTAYTNGLPLRVRVHVTNTGGATIDAGAGRVSIRKMNGGGTSPGDLPAGGIAELVYDGTAFQLVNFGGAGGGPGDQFLIKIPYAVDSSPTPNIVTAVFSPAITTLTAGDPLLVKIANTCTGSSVIRVNGLADKAIKANGGGNAPTLQGDLTAGDVVLFLYDGTDFWIQPNPMISADTTLNVPSQYSTVENALLAIRRKTIAQNARVTVLIGISTIAPFKINHANADRITIRGTMKIAGNLTGPMFAQTGNSAGARAADSANNIAMLRTRFGTEVQVPAAGVFTAGVENVGPGNPTVQDILITGPNYWSGDGIGRWVGATLAGGRYMTCVNVSTWGLDIGFYGGGTLIASYSFASGCFRNGAHVTSLGLFGFSSSGMFGGSLGGFTCNQNSWLGTSGCWANYNANHGAVATDNAQLTYHTSQAQGNAVIDLTAGPLSLMVILNSAAGGGYGTVSPTPGYMSAYGALIIEG